MAYYPEGKWYKLFLEHYDDNFLKKFENFNMEGRVKDISVSEELMKKEYDGLLESGMFYEWYPTMSGTWDADKENWSSLYDEILKSRKTVEDNQKNIFDETINNYKEEIIKRNTRIEFLEGSVKRSDERLENVVNKVESVIDALGRAIEQGNQLNIGIVLGQSLQQLSAAIYS